MKRIIFTMLFSIVSACSLIFPEDKNLVEVVPWRFIQEKDSRPPNHAWGRVPVSREEAENYDVIVGWKKFEKIISNRNLSQEEKVEVFSKFAINQVVLLGYCKEAKIPEGSMYLIGWEGSGRRGINVVCK